MGGILIIPVVVFLLGGRGWDTLGGQGLGSSNIQGKHRASPHDEKPAVDDISRDA
jgi:hypothetical protein